MVNNRHCRNGATPNCPDNNRRQCLTILKPAAMIDPLSWSLALANNGHLRALPPALGDPPHWLPPTYQWIPWLQGLQGYRCGKEYLATYKFQPQ